MEDIVVRMENAYEGLIEILTPKAGVHAEKVAEYYIKEKVVKLDPNIGRYNFAHGVFLEASVIDAAIEVVS